MASKSLKDKIKNVCLWTIGLSLLYFFIGAYLKSDGSEFDPLKTYDLIKDTLTLTASFLAPIAAFVLFTDWRYEHAAKSLFQLIEDVKKISHDLEKNLKQYLNNIYSLDQNNYKEYSNSGISSVITNQLAELSRLYLEIIEFDDNTQSLKRLINSFGESALKSKNALDMMDFSKIERLKLSSDHNSLVVNEHEIDFLKKYFKENYSIFSQNFKNIEPLNVEIIHIGKVIRADYLS